MVSCARKSDLMIGLIKDACRKIEAFTEETGKPLDWVHSGSLKIARRPQDGEVIEADFNRGRRVGLDVELISPEQASRLSPLLKPTGGGAAMRIGRDSYFDPVDAAAGLARGGSWGACRRQCGAFSKCSGLEARSISRTCLSASRFSVRRPRKSGSNCRSCKPPGWETFAVAFRR